MVLKIIAGQVEAQPAVEQHRLDAGLVGHGGFAVGDRQVAVEQDAALDRRRAIALGDARIDVDVLVELLDRADVPGQDAVVGLDRLLGDRAAADESRAEVELRARRPASCRRGSSARRPAASGHCRTRN